MRFTIFWLTATAASLSTSFAHAAQCPNSLSGPNLVRLDLGASDTSAGNAWRDAAISLASTNKACNRTITARYEHLRRFGTSNDTISVEGLFRANDESFWRVSALGGPDAVFVPEVALEVEHGRPFKFASGPLSAIVGSISTRYASYVPSDLASIATAAEIYPRNLNMWVSLRVSQAWSNEMALPATFLARIDRPLTDTTRVFALHVTGYEADQRQIEKVTASAVGFSTHLGPSVNLILTGSSEDRENGASRQTATFSIARAF